ncbi:MAG TPA: retropepsin-like aspartic protease [Pyrinomonadaceae bacterium]|nr:retropepsin-like aspartic protease [Pyrinomonadaceae bacterium]
MKRSVIRNATIAVAVLTVAVHAGTATSQQTSADMILARMAQALGGVERLRQVGTIYMHGKAEVAGLSGTVDEWQTSRGQRKQIIDLGDVYKQTTIFDGTRGWAIDRNNQISDLAGVSLQNEILANYFATFSYLFADRMPGTVTTNGEDPTGKYYLLRLKPNGGAEATFAIDKTSFLPFSMAIANAEGTSTIYYEDWREIDGIKLPFRYRQTEPDPTNNTLVQQQSIQLDTTIAATSFMRPRPAAPDFRFTNRQNSSRMHLERVDNAIFVQARINNSPLLWFVLDTGASVTAIDARRARALGLKSAGKVAASGAGGSSEVQFTKGVAFTLPGVKLVNQTVISVPFVKQFASVKRPFGGVLGYDFISRFVIELDFVKQTLTLHDPKNYAYKGAGKRLSIEIDGTPFMQAEVKVNGQEPVAGRFEIDTGYDGALSLYHPFVMAHPTLMPSATSDPNIRHGMEHSTTSVRAPVESVAFGGFSFPNVFADFPLGEGGVQGDKSKAGLIGNEILRRFKVIFDYSRQTMILEPNAHRSDPFPVSAPQ